jgi:hypothetical protein
VEAFLVPLAFETLSRGTVAFGFFNIDTDLLLLQQYFLFADDFCKHLVRISEEQGQEPFEAAWQVYSIDDPEKVGDLMAAIHGIRYTGFIGEVYRRFPFPKREAEFKQKPEGFQHRAWVISLLERWAVSEAVPVTVDQDKATVSIGEYVFTKKVFHQLVEYVWVGGYPRWKDGIRPDYVMQMKRSLEKSSAGLMRGLVLR